MFACTVGRCFVLLSAKGYHATLRTIIAVIGSMVRLVLYFGTAVYDAGL